MEYGSGSTFRVSDLWGLRGGGLMMKQSKIIYPFSCKLFFLNKLGVFFERGRSNSSLSSCRSSICSSEHL